MSRCIKGHYQPLLLLYADPRGTPVSVQDLTSRLDLHHYTKTYYDSEDSGKPPTDYSSRSKIQLDTLIFQALFGIFGT